MEGKLTWQKTLSESETNKIFKVMLDTNDIFIVVDKTKTNMPNGLPNPAELTTQNFNQVKRSIAILIL